MVLFPFFEDIEGKVFLVVGGGQTAGRKVKQLLRFTRDIRIVAPVISFDVPETICVLRKCYEPEDILPVDYCIGATDDPALNARIAADCRERKLPVNIVDDPSLCTFVFPSIIKEESLTIGITTCGKSPAASRYLRETVEEMLPEEIGPIIERMGALREKTSELISDQKQRAIFYKELLCQLLETKNRMTDEEIRQMLQEIQNAEK